MKVRIVRDANGYVPSRKFFFIWDIFDKYNQINIINLTLV